MIETKEGSILRGYDNLVLELLATTQPLGTLESLSLAIIAASISGLIGMFAMPIGKSLNIIDCPDGEERKLHDRPTPLVGGLAIMVPTLLSGLFFSIIYGIAALGILSFLYACMLILGLLDDRSHIVAFNRLAFSTIIFGGTVLILPEIGIVELVSTMSDVPVALGFTGVLLAVICLVGLQNAVNMADGQNGLVIGTTLIWTGLTAVYIPQGLFPFLLVFAAALAVTFVFNWRGKLFLGDAGAYSLSAVSSTLAIFSYKSSPHLTADMVVLWFAVPVMDCLRLIWFRLRQGASPFRPDRNHLHHYLSEIVPGHAGIATYLSLVGLPALVSILFPGLTFLMLALVTALYFGVLWFHRRRAGELVATGRGPASEALVTTRVAR